MRSGDDDDDDNGGGGGNWSYKTSKALVKLVTVIISSKLQFSW